jgi:hypothetical protein
MFSVVNSRDMGGNGISDACHPLRRMHATDDLFRAGGGM